MPDWRLTLTRFFFVFVPLCRMLSGRAISACKFFSKGDGTEGNQLKPMIDVEMINVTAT